jgi:hypothetical protein
VHRQGHVASRMDAGSWSSWRRRGRRRAAACTPESTTTAHRSGGRPRARHWSGVLQALPLPDGGWVAGEGQDLRAVALRACAHEQLISERAAAAQSVRALCSREREAAAQCLLAGWPMAGEVREIVVC